ncbi:conserved hypothetical protein [Leishmania braziliensis MHOM/BR/75/M2904]|uniref:Uncharacterized protein n=2 Tax=Leishmania braziliensis TaxID=5660 RepID=A4HBK2_LEIBR|nr:conserved hypothetical protein [Leishmania braziliensis MHOM/BR/75/M2904]CAJ2472317.1 unnamed protein product [Leishmania braziliensis]CAJ2472788.1 unnamed protein product [Leishmania braziliensis]CAM38789.1 conserved hypothetical protein [Leishmania braziliensis MHOM/BR/75/M2904]SYZ65612.1 hypothetical_protein [Leishmania braziliensis MHOM/BR/75/M2904]
MSVTTELAGLVRRLSPQAYERVLLLLHCLIASSEDNHCTSNPQSLSLKAICDVALCACPGPVPRFLFALSSNDKLLRSADCGLTWRLCFSRSSEPRKADAAGAQDLLDDVTSLLKSTVATDDVVSGDGASSVVCCADGYGDIVALCGHSGFLAVSGDKGVTFTTATDYLMSDFGEKAHLRHICVLDTNRILVSDDLRVVCVTVQCAGYGLVALGKARVALVCATQICMLHAYSMGGGARGAAVAENRKLHLSFDGAVSFVEVRHCLGRIRDFDTTAALRHCELPDFPQGNLASSLGLINTEVSTSPPRSASAYDYVSGYKRDTSASKGESAAALMQFEAGALRYGADVFYRFFFVAGCGAEVLPCDYSALLCVCTRREDNHVFVISTASSVSYIPFSQSRSHGRLLCAVARSADGSGSYVASRGSIVGTSVSRDLDCWSTPRGAAPVGLLAVGGGDILTCGRNKVVSRVGGDAEAHTILRDMRVPMLVTVFPM